MSGGLGNMFAGYIKARKRYVKRYFHSDTDDPHEYDLIINTARTGFDGAVKIIADATPKVPVKKK